MNPSRILEPGNEGRGRINRNRQKLQSDDFNIIGSHWAKYLKTPAHFSSFDTRITKISIFLDI